MNGRALFAEGIGTGVGLILLAGALAAAWRPDLVTTWAFRGRRTEQQRVARLPLPLSDRAGL
ncbi:MAG TPA: hypothetical protein VIX13_05335 [Candidatus Eisenbacteria bacterium]